MGYDISYHPIKESEMHDWYFNIDFAQIADKDYSQITPFVAQYQMEEYEQLYIDVLTTAVGIQPDEPFENGHGYFLAVVQGFFKPYFYTRGSGFSFLMADKPYFKAYTKPWEEILTNPVSNPIRNSLNQNYSAGVYIPPAKVVQLLADYEAGGQVKQDLDEFFSHGRIDIFLKALQAAKAQSDGLLEATEVIEPNPLNLEDTKCYSFLLNCDIEGALLYQQAAQEQFREIEKREGLAEGEFAQKATRQVVNIAPPPEAKPKEEKKGFFKQLFGW